MTRKHRNINTVQVAVCTALITVLTLTVPLITLIGLTVWAVGYLVTRSGRHEYSIKRAPSGYYYVVGNTGHVLHANLTKDQARRFYLTGQF